MMPYIPVRECGGLLAFTAVTSLVMSRVTERFKENALWISGVCQVPHENSGFIERMSMWELSSFLIVGIVLFCFTIDLFLDFVDFISTKVERSRLRRLARKDFSSRVRVIMDEEEFEAVENSTHKSEWSESLYMTELIPLTRGKPFTAMVKKLDERTVLAIKEPDLTIMNALFDDLEGRERAKECHRALSSEISENQCSRVKRRL